MISLTQAVKETGGRSLLGDKLQVLWMYITSVLAQKILGQCAEVGVYRGGTSRMIAKMLPDRRIYLFDTFSGMPAAGTVDVHKKGDFSDTSIQEVSKFLSDCPNVVMKPGFFPESANGLESERFAFVHLDADLYESTASALAWFYPRMAVGGVIVLDDYLWERCPGVQVALEEFMTDKKEKIIQHAGQAVIVKEDESGLRIEDPASTNTKGVKPFAIHRPGALGDVLLALYLTPQLRAKYGSVDIFAAPPIYAVLAEFAKTLGTCGFFPNSELRREEYEIVHPLIGYPFKDAARTQPTLMTKPLIHYFAEELGVPAPPIEKCGPRFELALDPPGPPYVTIQVKCGWSALKDWDLTNWPELVRQLQARGLHVCQIGGPDDPKIEGVNRSLLGQSFETNLAAQAQAACHVGLDSIFNHTTAIVWRHRGAPVPSVIMFGNTSPSGSGYPHNRNLYKAMPCQPCYVDPCRHTEHKACMKHAVKDVVDAVMDQCGGIVPTANTGGIGNVVTPAGSPLSGAVPISAVIICKNEEASIRKCLESVREADEIVVMDTGSTDGTLALLKGLAVELPQLRLFHGTWEDSFAKARNAALAHASHDWRLIIDCDETMKPGGMAIIRAAAATAKGRTLKTALRGQNGVDIFRSVRVFRRTVKYVGAIHEVPDTDDGDGCDAEIAFGYSPAHTGDPDRALRILLCEHQRNPTCTRTIYYLAREFWYRKVWDRAIELFTRHTETSSFKAERADAYLYLARIYWITQQGDKARTACMNAITINANFREALLLMAEMSFPKNAERWRSFAALANNEDVLFVRTNFTAKPDSRMQTSCCSLPPSRSPCISPSAGTPPHCQSS